MSVTNNHYQVAIEADPSLPIIRMTRDFAATPAQLLQAQPMRSAIPGPVTMGG